MTDLAMLESPVASASKLNPDQPAAIIYPDSDGLPMSDNTRQFRHIVTIQGGIAALFADDPNVFVAGDLLWYPVEGNNRIRAAPDAMVVFGRPPGDRGSYMQWREGGIAPQVVFEVLSPGNTGSEMSRKFGFYQQYGVEEYYIYDPDQGDLSGWLRQGDHFEEIPKMEGWISPRLGIRFSLEGTELVIYRPDGQRFEAFIELAQRAESERQRAESEHQRAESERQRAESERQRAESEHQRAERLAERLRALGVDPDHG